MNVDTKTIYPNLEDAKLNANPGEQLVELPNDSDLSFEQLQEIQNVGSAEATDMQYNDVLQNLSEDDLALLKVRMDQLDKLKRIQKEKNLKIKKRVTSRRAKNKIQKASRRKNRKK